MIKTLIVDDEKLVRKGLISTMPWEKFDVHIVGEANNGKTALDFMQHNEVDLLIADLTMPVMSGFELMRIVRSLFPDIYIVVLTCHQDFDYLQESMRLGAIDYIVKTQLETESMEDVLSRIACRIAYEQAGRILRTVPAKPETAALLCDWGIVKVNVNPNPDPTTNLPGEKGSGRMDVGSGWIDVGNGLWFVPCNDNNGDHRNSDQDELPQSAAENAENNEWIHINVYELKGVSLPILTKTLRSYVPKYVFFEYKPDKSFYELSFTSIHRMEAKKMEEEWKTVVEEWVSLHWINDDVLFDKLCKVTASLKPTHDQLSKTISSSVGQWSSICHDEELNSFIHHVPSLKLWHQYVHTLSAIRLFIRQDMQRFPYFHEIVISIVKSLNFIRQTEDFSFSRDDVAERFNMSRGYFSECFKEIVGKSYGEYLKEQQMNRAKVLIRQTDHPIYWIAEQTGFKDEKYFSKMFRAFVGLHPMEYRKKIEGGKDDR